jgi:hypothetical protein
MGKLTYIVINKRNYLRVHYCIHNTCHWKIYINPGNCYMYSIFFVQNWKECSCMFAIHTGIHVSGTNPSCISISDSQARPNYMIIILAAIP